MDRTNLDIQSDHDRIIRQGAQLDHQGKQITFMCTKIDKLDEKLDKMIEKQQDFFDKMDEKNDINNVKSAGHCEAIRQNCPVKNKLDNSWFWWIVGPLITAVVSIGIYVGNHIEDTGKKINKNETEINHLQADVKENSVKIKDLENKQIKRLNEQ